MSLIETILSWFKSFSEKRENKRRHWYLETKRLRRIKEKQQDKERFLYRIGNEFEDYVIGMFNPDRFELIHKSPTNEETGGRFVKSMILPDLRFREKYTGRRFWVECKFRANTEIFGSIVWCTENQLRNYKRTYYNHMEPVFIMLGVRGTSSNPDKLYCLNLERINFTELFCSTYYTNRIIIGNLNSLEQLFDISKIN